VLRHWLLPVGAYQDRLMVHFFRQAYFDLFVIGRLASVNDVKLHMDPLDLSGACLYLCISGHERIMAVTTRHGETRVSTTLDWPQSESTTSLFII